MLIIVVHVPLGDLPGARRQDEDIAMMLPFDVRPQEQALRAQQVLVEQVGDQFVVRAPVTQRGGRARLLTAAGSPVSWPVRR